MLDALLALGFLREGLVRNAAGKIFQTWRALTASILAVELGRVAERLEEGRRSGS